MRTYSFITEFNGKIYSHYYQCERSLDAFNNWVSDFVSQPYLSKMQRKQIIEDSLDKDDAPIPLKGLESIWCWWIFPLRQSLLLHFMETMAWEDNLPHTYTFIALYDGGTYISQHNGVDFGESAKAWLEEFMSTPYLGDSQKEILLSNFACNLQVNEESCNFKILHIMLCDKQLDLYIAKTKI